MSPIASLVTPGDEAIIRGFIGSPKQARLHPTSQQDRRAVVRAFARSLGGRSLTEATTADVAAWLDRPITQASRTTMLVYLQRLLHLGPG